VAQDPEELSLSRVEQRMPLALEMAVASLSRLG
jgi:hypothetical protein